MPAIDTDLDQRVEALAGDLVATRRDLHAHPELGFAEHRTAGLIAERLQGLRLTPRVGVGGTGVVADLEGEHDGPTLLVRADMDALPIEERSDAPYRSQEPGAMHACGHDGHVAMLLVAAQALAADPGLLHGRVRFLFQPAEELPPGGALAVIADGALEDVQAALGLHLWNPLPTGTIGVRPGAIMAAHDRFEVVLRGRGGHGGMPEFARDPLVGLAHMIAALQTVVSRGVSPLDAAVVTVGTAEAGSAFNVIPDIARMSGSIRSLDGTTRGTIHERVREVTDGVAAAFGLAVDTTIQEFCPILENDPELATVGERVAARVVGEGSVRRDFRTMASEDFAFVQQRVPGCFLFVGSGRVDGAAVYPHHHPSFDIDEAALTIGSRTLVHGAVDMLRTLARAPRGGA